MRHPFKFDLVIESVPTQAVDVLSMFDAWARQFVKKNQDYENSGGSVSDNFGIMGQFMKLNDKIHKLRKPLWDREMLMTVAGRLNMAIGGTEEELNFEDADEILDDIIGHAFLTKLYLQERRDAIPKKGMKENPKQESATMEDFPSMRESGMLSDSRTGYTR